MIFLTLKAVGRSWSGCDVHACVHACMCVCVRACVCVCVENEEMSLVLIACVTEFIYSTM